MSILNMPCLKKIDIPKLFTFATWPCAMITLQWLELPLPRTISMVFKMFEPLKFDCKLCKGNGYIFRGDNSKFIFFFSFEKKAYSKQKERAPLWSKLFPYSVDHFSECEGEQTASQEDLTRMPARAYGKCGMLCKNSRKSTECIR